MKKIIVFDLDDTLYKEIDFLKSAYQEIASVLELHYELNGVYSYLLEAYYAGLNTFEEVNKKFNINVPLTDYLRMYRNHVPQIYLNRGVSNVIRYLIQEKVCLGILTDGRTITQTNKICSLGLDKHIPIENWIISEAFGFEKPSLNGYLYFQDKYPGDVSFYYIGDNTAKDFIAPNVLKWKSFCLLDNGENIHKQDFRKPGGMLPTHVINDMTDLLKYI